MIYYFLLYLCAFVIKLEANEDVTFYLFKNSERSSFKQIDKANIETEIPKDGVIIFLIHGWSQNRTVYFYEITTNAYLSRAQSKYHVVQIDYSKTALKPYPLAVLDAPTIGAAIADFISSVVATGFPLEDIRVCGHSLGGQIASFVGRSFLNLTGKKLPTIIALDPAGPLFVDTPISTAERLTKDDAEVVIVIHTDGRKWGTSMFSGTIDVFPNGGTAIQPGCPDVPRGEICCHHKSYEIFAFAVEHPMVLMATECADYSSFLAGECKDNKKIDFGGELTIADKGSYYLTTTAQPPYV